MLALLDDVSVLLTSFVFRMADQCGLIATIVQSALECLKRVIL